MPTFDFELDVNTEDVLFEVENNPDDVEVDTSFTEQLHEVDGGAILVIDNHKDLKGRDLPNQHPISAITGLETALNGKQDVIPDLEEQKARLSALNMQYKEVIIPPEDLDLSSVEVSKDGAEYGFYYNQETNSLCPQNTGVDDSFSYGKITFNVRKDTTVIVLFRQSSEQNYDYGMISNLDEFLSHSVSNDSNVKWSGNPHGIIEDSITYDVPAGEHFITFKYVKDSSYGDGTDSFEITGITINGVVSKAVIDYDTGEEINLKPDMSDYYTKDELLDKYVTIDTEQTIYKKKVILCTEEVKHAGQESALKVLSTHSDRDLTEAMWAGRLTVGNKNQTFLMGVYHQVGSNTPMCGLGAHRWSNSLTDTGASWNDIYLQPDGNTSVYIGGYNWTANSGWFRVKNSGSNTGGKVQLNTGTALNPHWQDVTTKTYVDDSVEEKSTVIWRTL